MNNTIALMWDSEGLEAAANVSEPQRLKMWATLQGQDTRLVIEPNLMHWRLRAQANPQRHYEIYLIEVTQDVTVDDIREAFEVNPQNMADTVRRIGHEFYSDRINQEEVRIR